MSKAFGLYLLLVFNCSNILAQQVWQSIAQYGGSGSDGVVALTTVEDGQVVFAGSFGADFDFDNTILSSAGQTDAMLAAVDQNGKSGWILQAAGPRQDVSVDVITLPQGNLLWSGYFWERVEIGTQSITAPDAFRSVFLAQVTSVGAVQRVSILSGRGLKGVGKMAVDTSGNIYLPGYFSDSLHIADTTLSAAGTTDFFLAKFSAAGQLIWIQTAGIEGDSRGKAVSVLPDQSVVVAGQFQGVIGFGADTLRTGTPDNDLFIAGYSPGGALLWSRWAGGVLPAFCKSIASDSSGNFYLAGRHQGIIALNDTLEIRSPGFNDNAFLIAYTPEGQPRWGHSIGGAGNELAESVIVRSNELILAGAFSGDFQIESTPFLLQKGIFNAFYMAFSRDGKLKWSATVPGEDFVLGATTAPAAKTGDIIAAGTFFRTAAFDALELNTNGLYDIFIGVLNAALTPVADFNEKAAILKVFPNPASDRLYFEGEKVVKTATLFDIHGRVVLRRRIYDWSVSIAHLPKGTYLLQCQYENGAISKPVWFIRQ